MGHTFLTETELDFVKGDRDVLQSIIADTCMSRKKLQ